MFYNTDTGKVWRYVKKKWAAGTGARPKTSYCWQELQDTELSQALALAKDALATANKKAQIFVATPTTPYYVGDLWVQGSTGDILRCKIERLEGSFSASDWEKASKYTDNSELTNFINNNFANTVSDLTTQIDGKIESWFQTTDPASSWTFTEKAKHVGDMWYNTQTKELNRYRKITIHSSSSSFSKIEYLWSKIEDKTALDAYDAASKAQDTADGKRQVFVSQPYPPYDIGDLWLTGDSTNGQLKRCATARATGSFVANDWVIATYYDNTQTTIDGGIVTAGTVQLANGNSQSIVAGITGGETEAANTSEERKVRIWAGASKENRFTAPFRVLQNGTVHATKAYIEGTVKATDGEFNGMVKINGGTILLNKDGSGKLANGNVEWDKNGNVTLKNVTANNGTFQGVINATGGLIMSTQKITSANTYIKAQTTYCKVYIVTNDPYGNPVIYFPSSPNIGQYLIVKNAGDQILLDAGKYYVKGSVSELYETDYSTTHEGDLYARRIYIATRRIKGFVFDGSFWNSVTRYDL